MFEGFLLATLLLVRGVVRGLQRHGEERDRWAFLAQRIDEVNQRRLVFLPAGLSRVEGESREDDDPGGRGSGPGG